MSRRTFSFWAPEGKGGAGASVVGAIGRLCGALLPLLMVLGLWLAPVSSVRADPGRAVGWALETASQELLVGKISLRFDPVLADDAYELMDDLPSWWSEIEQSLAHDLDDSLTIHFVTHAGRVAQATGMPEWVKGVANPPRGEIAISLHAPDGSVSDFATTLRHELVHVALYRAAGNRPLPRWFHEGVAESLTEEISLARSESLAQAVFGPGVPTLERFDAAFNGDRQRVEVAYAAARDFVTFLRYYDDEGHMFRRLFSELRNDHGFEASFIRSYDLSLGELDQQWRSGLLGRFMWYPLMASGTLPFLLFAPIGTVAWFRRRREFKKGLARMAAEEELERRARLEALERAGLGQRPGLGG